MSFRPLISILSLVTLVSAVSAQTESPVQSPARPFGLEIVAPVMLAASDESSKQFQTEVLPTLLDLTKLNLSERVSIKDLKAVTLDPKLLTLQEDSLVRTYFLGEGAAFKNTLGFSTEGGSPFDKTAQLIFPDTSDPTGLGGSGGPLRTTRDPLMAGDFVDLGKFAAGTQLDFFLISDGANGGKRFFSTNHSLNGDGLVHAVSFQKDGTSYFVIGFEDIWGGGDRDFNDTLFVLEFKSLGGGGGPGVGVPEPSMAMGAMLAVALMAGVSRRRKH
jgi:hypothetical protein